MLASLAFDNGAFGTTIDACLHKACTSFLQVYIENRKL
jgi:hypothetical protein